jgi:hypothetical protein
MSCLKDFSFEAFTCIQKNIQRTGFPIGFGSGGGLKIWQKVKNFSQKVTIFAQILSVLKISSSLLAIETGKNSLFDIKRFRCKISFYINFLPTQRAQIFL